MCGRKVDRVENDKLYRRGMGASREIYHGNIFVGSGSNVDYLRPVAREYSWLIKSRNTSPR